MDPSYSFFFIIIIFNLLELRELFFFSGMLNTRFLGGGSEKAGQADAICPLLQQRKQSPFLAHCSHSSGVSFLGSLTTSTSMALGSLVFFEDEEKDWKV